MIVSTLEAVLRADISDFTAGLQQADQMLADVAERMSARIDGISALTAQPGGAAGLLPSPETALPNLGGVAESVSDRLTQAVGSPQHALTTTVALAPELSVNIGALVEQMQRFVDEAAASKIFKVTLLADVTVLANRINLDRLIGSVSSAINAIRIGGGSSGQSAALPTFANGGVMPHEGLAYLHPGERVLTAAETRAYDGVRGGGPVVVNAYGESPYELARLIDRARSETGV